MVKHSKPVLDPTTQAFVDALAAHGGKPLYEPPMSTLAESSRICKQRTSRNFRPISKKRSFRLARRARCPFGFIARLA